MARSDAKAFSFQVDEESDVPLWAQLRNRLAYLIASGYYQPGEQLPTVRALASEISINYNTVNKAYLSLKADGYIEATRGRGAFVRDMSAGLGDENAGEVDVILGDCIAACRGLGLSLDEISRAMDAKIAQFKHEERNGAAAFQGEGEAGR